MDVKKILAVATAVVGTVAMADIVSSSVVGYQNKTVNSEVAGGYTWTLATMPAVGVDLDKLTLGSWQVTPPQDGLTSEVSVYVNTFDTAGQIAGAYVYLDAAQCAVFGVEPGWYTFESVANWAPESADNVIIPYGEGVQIGSDCGATVTFSGEVLSEDKSFTINGEADGGYTWTGNCTPVDLTLADFAITPPQDGLTSEVSVYVNTFDTAGQIAGAYVYLDAAQCAVFGVEPGWYTFESVANWAPETAGSVKIEAGEMFQIGSDCGATITVPSAL